MAVTPCPLSAGAESSAGAANGLTGAEVQVRLAMGVRGNFLRPTRGELLDRAELEVCLDIIGAASAVRGEVLNGVVLHARRRGRTGTTSEGFMAARDTSHPWSTSKPTTLPSTESRNPYRTGGESGALHSRG